MRVCDVSKTDEVHAVAQVTITMLGADGEPQGDPVIYQQDLGERATTALGRRDWAELARIQPANERSKDKTRVAAAAKRATTRGGEAAATVGQQPGV